MILGYIGRTHLGQTMMAAAIARGFGVIDYARPERTQPPMPDLLFLTRDVDKPEDKAAIIEDVAAALPFSEAGIPVIVMSQVPPNFMWSCTLPGPFYYQVDTLIMNRAVSRAVCPEQIIIGCEDPEGDLPAAYAEYCAAFECPVLRMNYEDAEFTKIAINYLLGAQVAAAITLANAAKLVGAEWLNILPALRNDARLRGGYLLPGSPIGGHLPRDIRRIRDIERRVPDIESSDFTAALEALCES